MNDREFLEAFEHCTLPGDSFHHSDHIRLGWLYVREHPLPEAIGRFVATLQRFAASKGAAGLYHETITWAFLLLIHERMQRGGDADYETFRANNADLYRWKPSVLDEYYLPETLASDLARRVFVLPDRASGYTAPRPVPTEHVEGVRNDSEDGRRLVHAHE
ncbi:MAG TPA: hypothetical protein VF698_05055 [Thermoanaerobaculia bacterium]|jgi:hypothetical protein